jgi:hypothetical protein
MRPIAILSSLGLATLVASVLACSGSPNDSGFNGNGSSGGGSGSSGSGGGSNSSGGSSSGNSSGGGSGSFGSSSGSSGGSGSGGDGGVTTKTIVYAHTDNTLFSVDPATSAVTMIGQFTGGATTITDLAVDVNNEVYVNSETAVFKAALPSGGTGSVTLTQLAAFTGVTNMYALAFTPKGSLDPNNETLLGGDGAGTVWAIDTTSGATKNLGNFGADPSNSCTAGTGCTLGLSGDLVFYTDSNGAPTGLATIRSCGSGGKGCSNDWLAGVDMTALNTAYTSGMPATTGHALLKGVYGGSSTSLGAGTGFHSVYGLAAYNSKIFGFTRSGYNGSSPPSLITIDTGTGAGSMVSNSFSFTNGWSGAGVTTQVHIVAPPPPPPPNQ